MTSLLQTIVEKKHYTFLNTAVTWQEAVRLSAEPLVADGSVDANYYQRIVNCIQKYGPYVVFDHEVAMPHATQNADGVHKTAIGFLVSKEPVHFGLDMDGEEKNARLFFTLAACDPNQHLENIQQLMDIFVNEPLLDALMNANSPEDILAAEANFPLVDDGYLYS